MFFVLANILASFRSYINKILTKKLNGFGIVYMTGFWTLIEDPAQDHVTYLNVDFIKMKFFFWAASF